MSKELYQAIIDNGMAEYGTHIPAEFVRNTIGLKMPDVATKQEFDKIALLELAAIDYVRNIMLNQGKYIKGENGGYRILLPSENAQQVENYMSSADQKLRRAIKLAKNTPKEFVSDKCNNATRAHMKRESIARERRIAKLM